MTFDIKVEEGGMLYQAAAFRGASSNYAEGVINRLGMAQQSADMYSTVLNEVAYILLVALGKVKDGEDGEGDPLTLAREAAEKIAEMRKYENYFYTGDGGTVCQ